MSESESENHVARLSLPLRLCLSVDRFGGEQDRVELGNDKTGLLYRYDRIQVICAGGREGRHEAEVEAGGLEVHKERSHRVVCSGCACQ